jgi:hypothetical protein
VSIILSPSYICVFPLTGIIRLIVRIIRDSFQSGAAIAVRAVLAVVAYLAILAVFALSAAHAAHTPLAFPTQKLAFPTVFALGAFPAEDTVYAAPHINACVAVFTILTGNAGAAVLTVLAVRADIAFHAIFAITTVTLDIAHLKNIYKKTRRKKGRCKKCLTPKGSRGYHLCIRSTGKNPSLRKTLPPHNYSITMQRNISRGKNSARYFPAESRDNEKPELSAFSTT